MHKVKFTAYMCYLLNPTVGIFLDTVFLSPHHRSNQRFLVELVGLDPKDFNPTKYLQEFYVILSSSHVDCEAIIARITPKLGSLLNFMIRNAFL